MAKCGCAHGGCFCEFEDSTDVTWEGSGLKSDPFRAVPRPLIVADDTPTLALTLEIGDTEATLTAQPITAGYVDVFTSDGTWVKPAGITFARVMMIGGGGGGGAGSSEISTALRLGGGGGDAGQVAILNLTGSSIPSSAAVDIGQGGLGGIATANAPGAAGSNGGSTSFGSSLVRGGVGGAVLGQAGNHLSAGNPQGQFAVDYDADWNPAHYYLAPGAGGVGESIDFPARVGGYSHPGMGSRFPGNTGGGDIGEDGRDEPVTKMGGGGGGGAASENGGNGGLYGGGGGGGGTGIRSKFGITVGGNGGNGAPGYVVVISW